MAGIYFHIPFCRQACHYCDFHFSTNLAIRKEMVESILKELKLQQHYLGHDTIETIYFGGGTPSLLTVEELASLVHSVYELFEVRSDAEVTLESNPDDLSTANLNGLIDLGINRLSIGIQTFDDQVLHFLNRVHSSADAREAMARSRAVGFKNISLDLIYAIPGQSEAAWIENINQAVQLNPEHISAYNLTIESETVFGNWSKKGKLVAVADDFAATQLENLVTILAQANYQQYEVSNFCKPGFESKHNSSYWQRKAYLGIGPSAHSYNKESRQYNVRNNHTYVKALSSGTIPFEREMLNRDDQVNEYLLTTLRTAWGTNLRVLRDEYGYDLMTEQQKYVGTLIANGLATVDNEVLKLTPKGKMMADKISSDLFLIR